MDSIEKIAGLKKAVEEAKEVSKNILALVGNETNVVGVLAVMAVYNAQRDMNPRLHMAMAKLMAKAIKRDEMLDAASQMGVEN